MMKIVWTKESLNKLIEVLTVFEGHKLIKRDETFKNE